MNVWHGLEAFPPGMPECTVAIGRFDGVHIGHQALISAAVRDAHSYGRPCVVFTFDRHPAELFAPERAPEYLTSLYRKVALIRALGPDHILIACFDERFRDLSPEAFLHFVVSGMLRAKAVFVGEDFHFGFEHAGDVAYLRSAEERFGYRTEIVPAVLSVDGQKASSSRIRQLLYDGELGKTEEMLGHPYVLDGSVVPGEKLGRKLGYPTANLEVSARQLVPKDGIYAAWADCEGDRHAAACSIGIRPTVGGTARTIEAYLLDFSGDLYGKPISLEFVKRLRNEEKFQSLDALVEQIARDVEEVRRVTYPS
jgi:riboflavin kinase / FMN adenylyltransferase